MCGIIAIICKSDTVPENIIDVQSVRNRGPDVYQSKTLNLGAGCYLHMISSVLHLRGFEPEPQPYSNRNGDLLQWNGEIFDGLEVNVGESDTATLAEKLGDCKNDTDICQVFKTLHGPWAFVFYHNLTKKVWFGKDYFGRRSLLWRKIGTDLYLSSVASKPKLNDNTIYHWNEVQADGLYVMETISPNMIDSIKCYHWQSITQPKFCKYNAMLAYESNYSNKLLCTIGNKSFDSGDVYKPNLTSPIKAFSSFHEANAKLDVTGMSYLEALVHICEKNNIWLNAKKLILILKESVQKRVSNVPRRPGCSASVSVLFSGGLDCTVLALLAHEYIPISEPIDLLNVAFKTPKNMGFDVPDRVTGRSSYKELELLCPDRKWNFVEINVGIEELQVNRQKIIADLTYPLATVLDDSIGCALWFAARGETSDYKSATKVLICGMGADEQLGGYSRHRSTFDNRGWLGLDNELKMEVERISSRNLCRDDRVTADHGKEARFPYLDENVVSYLNQTPLCCKVDLNYGRGVGEKIILRAAAYHLGLREAASLPKRAIQFGSRIAKAECKKEKASDICARLL